MAIDSDIRSTLAPLPPYQGGDSEVTKRLRRAAQQLADHAAKLEQRVAKVEREARTRK